jgi:8-oxo-dGTP pyrophosphatase MutT (NUDIX family)
MPEKKKLYRAGLIPYVVEQDIVKMMFIVPDDPSGKYGGEMPQIAKGKIEDGETVLSAALREAKEELGLFTGNLEHTEEVGSFMGRTTVFVGKIKDTNLFGDPTTPNEVKDRVWLTLEQFLQQGRDLHKPVIKAAHRKICKIENLDCE